MIESTPFSNELQWVHALCEGDEAAFVSLLEHYDAAMSRIALLYVSNLAVAEEVVQETWINVLQGLKHFEGRSSLKTWIFRILINCAQRRGERERRSIAFSALAESESEAKQLEEEEEQFLPSTHAQWPGRWVSFPRSWEDVPEEHLLSQETRLTIDNAIKALPLRQREVIVMRDVEGWTSDEVCNFLGVSVSNQRVLLHRARSSVRRVIERYLNGEEYAS